MFVTLRVSIAGSASTWVSEDLYRRDFATSPAEKIADAFIMSPNGNIERVIEFIGDYGKARLQEFHDYWSSRQIPYEWR